MALDNMDPTTAFLIAAGSGLMGTRGPGGFGRAGMMGLESMDRARRTAVLEAESRQRELERQSAEQMRALQMKQIEAAMAERAQEQAKVKAIQDAAKSSVLDRAGLALSAGGGPTTANAATMERLPEGAQTFDETGFTNRVMAIDPLAGLKLRDEMRQRNAPKLTTLAEGATLLSTDPVTGKTTRVAAGGPNPNKPFFIGEDGQMQPNPAYQAYELAKASAGRSSTNVILPTLEREEQKAKGTANVRYFSETVTPAADAARRGNALLESQRRTIESGFETGWGVPQIAGAANVLGSVFGIKDAERYASKAATFQAAMFDQVLQKQLAQKGPQTESDAARMQQTLAQASTPAAASKFLIDFATAQNDRDIGRQKFFADWWRKKGTYEGAEEAWNDAEGGVSIFSSPRLQTYGGAKPAGFRYLGKEQ